MKKYLIITIFNNIERLKQIVKFIEELDVKQ